MPTRSEALAPVPTRLGVDLGNGATLAVVFDKIGVTTDWARRLDEAASGGNVMAAAEGLSQVILSWDLVEDDGTPVPPSAHELALLSMQTLDALGSDLIKAAKPGAAEKNVLSASSPVSTGAVESSAAASETSPNGSDVSPLPTSSASLSPT